MFTNGNPDEAFSERKRFIAYEYGMRSRVCRWPCLFKTVDPSASNARAFILNYLVVICRENEDINIYLTFMILLAFEADTGFIVRDLGSSERDDCGRLK